MTRIATWIVLLVAAAAIAGIVWLRQPKEPSPAPSLPRTRPEIRTEEPHPQPPPEEKKPAVKPAEKKESTPPPDVNRELDERRIAITREEWKRQETIYEAMFQRSMKRFEVKVDLAEGSRAAILACLEAERDAWMKEMRRRMEEALAERRPVDPGLAESLDYKTWIGDLTQTTDAQVAPHLGGQAAAYAAWRQADIPFRYFGADEDE